MRSCPAQSSCTNDIDDVAVKWRVVYLMPSALSTAGRAAAKT